MLMPLFTTGHVDRGEMESRGVKGQDHVLDTVSATVTVELLIVL